MFSDEAVAAAVAHLKQTTVGYINKNWKVPPQGTHWKAALDLLTPAPPPPPTGKPLVGNITSGGTYTGRYDGVVNIATTQTVIVDGAVGNIQFRDSVGGYDLTVMRSRITGVGNLNDPRWMEFDQGWKYLVVKNNTIENTRGIYLGPNKYNANPVTRVWANKHKNIKGTTEASLNDVGNFLQLAVVWGGPTWDTPVNPNPGIIEVGWNEIENVINESNAEDIFSVYKTGKVRLHDNLINGHTKPDNMSGSSQGGITIDGHDEPNLCYDVVAYDNVIVDAYGAYIDGGTDCHLLRNIVISDGKMGDTGRNVRFGYSGVAINRRAVNCSAEANTAAYIGNQGRVDFQPDGGIWTGNFPLPGTPTRQTETDAIAAWHARAAAAGVTIGA